MHYIDGTEAREGDIVKGTGYNIPYVITGPVTKLIHGQDSCNIRVEVRISKWNKYYSDGDGGTDVAAHFEYETYEEAGEAKAFTLVAREGWTHTPLRTPRGEIYGYIWLSDDPPLFGGHGMKPDRIS